MPVTIPVPAPIVATPVLLLLQLPPTDGLVRVIVAPWHTLAIPDMGAGIPETVIVAVAIQPVANVYVIVAVPADTPVTTPVDEPIEAIAVLLLLQLPPPLPSLKVVVAKRNTVMVPVMEAGKALTVTACVT